MYKNNARDLIYNEFESRLLPCKFYKEVYFSIHEL